MGLAQFSLTLTLAFEYFERRGRLPLGIAPGALSILHIIAQPHCSNLPLAWSGSGSGSGSKLVPVPVPVQ